MATKMTTSKIVKAFLMNDYETTDKTKLAEDWGVRVRMVGDKVEFATTYFYQNQHRTPRLVEYFNQFAARFNVAAEMPTENQITFNTKPWPKQSWASVTVSVNAI